MSLIFCDGFDDGLFTNKWSTFINTSIIAGGLNGNGLQITNAGSVTKVVPAAYEHATFIFGAAIKVTTLPGNILDPVLLGVASDNALTTHMNITLDNVGRVSIKRGSTNLGFINSFQVQANKWYYMELKVTLSDTVGVVQFRVDGVMRYSTSNFDTKNAGTKTVLDGVLFSAGSSPGTMVYDDLYICNGSGSTNNDFLGPIAIETKVPDGNGNSSQFVGSDADSVDNYLLVDEAAPNTSDYVESATVGNKDTYSFADLTRTTGNVLAVQPTMYAQKSDAGTRTARLIARSGGNEGLSDVKNLSVGWAAHSYPYDQDPNGNINWTISSANAAEFGYQVDS